MKIFGGQGEVYGGQDFFSSSLSEYRASDSMILLMDAAGPRCARRARARAAASQGRRGRGCRARMWVAAVLDVGEQLRAGGADARRARAVDDARGAAAGRRGSYGAWFPFPTLLGGVCLYAQGLTMISPCAADDEYVVGQRTDAE